MKIGVISGYFDPIHEGHIAMINEAAGKCDFLVAVVNCDEHKIAKAGKVNIPENTRRIVTSSIKGVDACYIVRSEDRSMIEELTMMRNERPDDTIVFFNGGDRNSGNIPELSVEGIEFEFGIGGDFKMNSSSEIMK